MKKIGVIYTDIDAAIKTLEDYKKINPGDPELNIISKEIRGIE